MRIGIRHPFARVGTATLGLALVVGLAACVPHPEPSSSPTPAIDLLCADPLVISCEYGSVVTVDGDRTADELSSLLPLLKEAAVALQGSLTLRGEATNPSTPDPDVTPLSRWELTVPAEGFAGFETTLSEVIGAASVPGALRVTTHEGWPSVTIQTLDQFAAAFEALRATALFEDGGTYSLQSPEEHLRIVHVPSRTSDLAIAEIIAIARDYPQAEVLLEATTYRPQEPTFYVSRLSPDEVTSLDARLRDPRLSGADVDGYPLDYVLGSLGADGVTYTTGTFGDVPEAG